MRVSYLCDYAIFLYKCIIKLAVNVISGCGAACGQLILDLVLETSSVLAS